MASVILFANGRAKDEIQELSSSISGISGLDLMIVGDSSLEGIAQEATIFATDGLSFAEAVRSAIKAASSDRVILVDARSNPSTQMMQSFVVEDSASAENTVMQAAIEFEGDFVDAADLSADQIVSMIKNGSEWPVAVFSARKQFLLSEMNDEVQNSLELVAQLIIRSISSGMEIGAYSNALPLSANQAQQIMKPSRPSSARLLKATVDAFAIEDLFPNHAWKEHTSEAAAACYQTIAALFISFGDTTGALDCLKLSDGLEESPRSLALRGIIAQLRGETLGAVANMVSSLQQYEVRKKTNGSYISFEPQDIEQINSSLVSGLDALNRRENSQALDHFAEAVFNFDNFYSQFGLDRIRD